MMLRLASRGFLYLFFTYILCAFGMFCVYYNQYIKVSTIYHQGDQAHAATIVMSHLDNQTKIVAIKTTDYTDDQAQAATIVTDLKGQNQVNDNNEGNIAEKNAYLQVKDTMSERTDIVKAYCKNITQSPLYKTFLKTRKKTGYKKSCGDLEVPTTAKIYVLEELKVVFCAVFKAASSEWKKLLVSLHDTYKQEAQETLEAPGIHTKWQNFAKPLKEYLPSERCHVLETFNKVMIVRNPYERLVSCFNDKFRRNTDYCRMVMQPGVDCLAMNLNDFVEQLSFGWAGQDPHWRSFFDTCLPCEIQYNNIVKFETLARDRDYFLETLGLSGRVNFSKHTSSSHKNYFDNMTQELSNKIYSIYEVDFLLYNYSKYIVPH
ncbi:unnamed protein product [Owenia fusiformis]|uniref:Carbohydrate sulfotransferase n=1 Tax=Owenia fusiformis TaxID=6347 RepID=A0A8J1XZW0_OWEFU|nr:unnamed protein product [Owenia fusiformis]